MNVEKAYKIPNYYLCVCYLMMESHWNCMPSVIKLLRRVKWQMKERKKKIHHIICRFQWDCYREKLLERTTSHVTPVWNDPNGFHKRITNASKWIHNKTITHWKWVVIECALWHSKHFPKDFSNILLPFKQIFVWIPFELGIYLQW